MESRSFTIGFICGAIIGATALWLIYGESGEEVTITNPQHDANSVIAPNVVTVAPQASEISQELLTEEIPEVGEPQSSSEISIDPAAPFPARMWAELEREPKEDSWAYYMEQTLLQYLGAHPTMAQFDISRIECRTTKCQIEVIGFDDSTVPVWQQVMYDIRQQPWSDFGQSGTSSGTIEGRVTIVGELQRIR